MFYKVFPKIFDLSKNRNGMCCTRVFVYCSNLTELTESLFYLGFCLFSGDAWIYCISKNEWVQFEHNYSEKPRYGRQLENCLEMGYRRAVEAPGGGCQREEPGSSSQLPFQLSQRCSGCVLTEFQGRQPVKQQEAQNLGFDLRI